MVDKLARLTADERSDFVAYLDGELTENQTQNIERMLAQNEVARHDLESLATVWELLDTLPKTKAPEDFAQKTIATLKMSEQERSFTDEPWFQQATVLAAHAVAWVAVLAVGLAGYLGARSYPPAEADLLIQNYELLNELDRYREIRSVDFLKRLQSSPEWMKQNTTTE
ncbi:MAG: hypothetical protein KDA78_17710 [Planctomycetaceae bacterium]|nr:hypothetical protein [Planctomycetaceae bacterium]